MINHDIGFSRRKDKYAGMERSVIDEWILSYRLRCMLEGSCDDYLPAAIGTLTRSGSRDLMVLRQPRLRHLSPSPTHSLLHSRRGK